MSNHNQDGILNREDSCPAVVNTLQLDDDGDTVGNLRYNGTMNANSSQLDTNGDGFGNYCDADLNIDGVITLLNLPLLRDVFYPPVTFDADLKGDGAVNFPNVMENASQFSGTPGPNATN